MLSEKFFIKLQSSSDEDAEADDGYAAENYNKIAAQLRWIIHEEVHGRDDKEASEANCRKLYNEDKCLSLLNGLGAAFVICKAWQAAKSWQRKFPR